MKISLAVVLGTILLILIVVPTRSLAQENCDDCFTELIPCSEIAKDPPSGAFSAELHSTCRSPEAPSSVVAHQFDGDQACTPSHMEDCYSCGQGGCHTIWNKWSCLAQHNTCLDFHALLPLQDADALPQDVPVLINLIALGADLRLEADETRLSLISSCGAVAISGHADPDVIAELRFALNHGSVFSAPLPRLRRGAF